MEENDQQNIRTDDQVTEATTSPILHGYRQRVLAGLFAAGLIGIGTAWVFNVAVSARLNFNPLTAWRGIHPETVLWASAPFVTLALVGSGRLAPWLIGLAITAAFWAVGPFLLVYGIDTIGVNFGPLWLILLAPFVTVIAQSIAVHKLGAKDAADLSGIGVCAFFGVLGTATTVGMLPGLNGLP